MEEKLYGPIGIARLLDIEVYKNGNLLFDGIVDNAPEEIKKLCYKKVKLTNGICIFEV